MQLNLIDLLFGTPEPTVATLPDPASVLLEEESVLSFVPELPPPAAIELAPIQPQKRDNGQDFVLTRRDHVVVHGEVSRIRANLEAIRVLQRCQSEERAATSEEQAILAKWCSWGPVARIFDRPTPLDLYKHYEELTSLLSSTDLDRLLESAQRTVTNAFFTEPDIATAIWRGLSRFGLEGVSTILEPAVGSGIFLGTMPESLRMTSNILGIELDSLTSQMCQKLYPSATIRNRGFQSVDLPAGSLDLIISNVPFSSVIAIDQYDPELRDLAPSLHDFFFAKALKALRPGGILAFITSIGTLDKKHSGIREWLATRAELVGALRLPNTAFAGNANTKVVTDIVVMQKLQEPRSREELPTWVHSCEIDAPDDHEHGVPWINNYYHENPEMILGTPRIKVWNKEDPRSRVDYVVDGDRRDLPEAIEAAFTAWFSLGRINVPAWRDQDLSQRKPRIPEEDSRAYPTSLPDWSFVFHEGTFWVHVQQEIRPLPIKVPASRFIALQDALVLRDTLLDLLQAQRSSHKDGLTDTLRAELNKLYDTFVLRHGPLNSRGMVQILRKDYGTGHYLLALENWDSKTQTATKADIFSRRTQVSHTEPTSADSAADALVISLSARGRIDFPYMESLTGKTEDELIADLGDSIFFDPALNLWITADIYLTGAVRTKLRIAREVAKERSDLARNVTALEAALPPDFGPDRIIPTFGATWIPAGLYESFLDQTIGGSWTVSYVQSSETFEVSCANLRSTEWDVVSDFAPRKALWLVEHMIKGGAITVTSTDPLEKKQRVHADETTQANYKAEKLRDMFQQWIWASETWAPKLIRIYNDRFNDWIPVKYNGTHLLHETTSSEGKSVHILRGQNPAVQLSDHQVNVTWRSINSRATLYQHDVGTGKTYSLIASAMECRRLGLSKKPMITSPNYVFAQFASMWRYLYPDAKLLLIDPLDLNKDNRPVTMSRIATGDWDGIVVAHSSFAKIPMSPAFQEEFFENVIWDIRQEMDDADKSKSKELQEAINRIESRLSRLEARWNKDKGPYFDELGVDFLGVDEAHEYKNLYLPSKMRESGINTAHDVQKSWDMFMKSMWLHRHPSSKLVYATGTPVSNSMTELYVMMKYLQPGYLDSICMGSFDSWARTYGLVAPDIEATVDGAGVRIKSRFRKFINVTPLQMMWDRISDVVKLKDTAIEIPPIIGGSPEKVVVERSDFQSMFVEDLKIRITKVSEGAVPPHQDNMLKIVTDGRKLALDQRLIDPRLPDQPNSKINLMVSNAYTVWQETQPHLGTQLIWCDLGTPTKKRKLFFATETAEEEDAKEASLDSSTGEPDIDMDTADEFEEVVEGISLYEDIRGKLVAKGIPLEEIAFIHEAKTKEMRASLFQTFREGKIRILIASTGKLSMGANIQLRLAAAHHLHPTWKPSEMEQRDGRILRQGNMWTYQGGVRIFRYLTKGTFDAYMYQTLETKANFLDQFFSGKGMDEIDNIEFASDAYAELKAAAAADPRIMEMVKLQHEVKNLETQRRAKSVEIYTANNRLASARKNLEFHQQMVEELTPLVGNLINPTIEEMEIFGKTYENHKEAGTALWSGVLGRGTNKVLFGRIRGLDLFIQRNGASDRLGWHFSTSNEALGYRSSDAIAPVPMMNAVFAMLNHASSRLTSFQNELAIDQRIICDLEQQCESLKQFDRQEELDEKKLRLSVLQKELQQNENANDGKLAWDRSCLEYFAHQKLIDKCPKERQMVFSRLVHDNVLPGYKKHEHRTGLALLHPFWDDAVLEVEDKITRRQSQGLQLEILAAAFTRLINRSTTLAYRQKYEALQGAEFLQHAGFLMQVQEYFGGIEQLPKVEWVRITKRTTEAWNALTQRQFPQFNSTVASAATVHQLRVLGYKHLSSDPSVEQIRDMHRFLNHAQASALSLAA